ncbi:MAG: HlyD family efflux transporter periplasmic adaptor subunit [Thermoguttaceae bacterium]|nr:HlyD family efflux transporter periplasmic adaptor subunit [Thermoguttaceae bacterium]MDW8077287.1 HlyD family efflux transporter periplasmic adaptor subunit [Thermoguttaceae bacterium]
MSFEQQQIDPQLIEQARQQIRNLVNEIAQLARADIPPDEFYREFLPRVVGGLAAIGGAVWLAGENGRLILGYQVNLQEAKLHECSEEDQGRHARLLHRVLGSDEGILVAPHSGYGESDGEANPTDFLLVLAPLRTEVERVGVVEIFQRPNPRVETQRGYLRFLSQMCDLAAEYLKGRQLRQLADRQALWGQMEEFIRLVHGNLNPRTTAYVIANEGRRLIGCDRVTVAIRRGTKCRIEAISGQDVIDRRSNTVRLLTKLATVVTAADEPVWFTGDTRHLAPQVEEAIEDYVDQSHSKTVAVIPLRRPQLEPVAEEEPDKRPEPPPVVGALIVERIEDARLPETMVNRIKVVAEHAGAALANALEYHSLFLLPLWRAIGKWRVVVAARNLPRTIVILSVALAAAVALFVVPMPFKLQAKGTLEPSERYRVFTGIDGVVEEVFVDHGAKVSRGSELARLRNTDLEVEIRRVTGELVATLEDINKTHQVLLRGKGRLSEAERAQLQGRLAELEATLRSLEQQRELLLAKRKELTIFSPADGEVITWDVKNLLKERPVRRGDVLMEIANPQGDWQLEILMPERRMGHIARMRSAIKAANPQDDLDVEYVLASQPDRTLRGKVKEIHQAAEVREEHGNVVVIKVAINKSDLPIGVRPGAAVSAKVYCGKVSLVYWLLHDVIDFVRTRVLFRLF